jgi:hypothetical protein
MPELRRLLFHMGRSLGEIEGLQAFGRHGRACTRPGRTQSGSSSALEGGAQRNNVSAINQNGGHVVALRKGVTLGRFLGWRPAVASLVLAKGRFGFVEILVGTPHDRPPGPDVSGERAPEVTRERRP